MTGVSLLLAMDRWARPRTNQHLSTAVRRVVTGGWRPVPVNAVAGWMMRNMITLITTLVSLVIAP